MVTGFLGILPVTPILEIILYKRWHSEHTVVYTGFVSEGCTLEMVPDQDHRALFYGFYQLHGVRGTFLYKASISSRTHIFSYMSVSSQVHALPTTGKSRR